MTKKDDTDTSMQSLDPEIRSMLEDGGLDELFKALSSNSLGTSLSHGGSPSEISSSQVGVSLAEAKEYQKLFSATQQDLITESIEEVTKERAEKEAKIPCPGEKTVTMERRVAQVQGYEPFLEIAAYYLGELLAMMRTLRGVLDQYDCEEPCQPRYKILALQASRRYLYAVPQVTQGVITFSYVWSATVVLRMQKRCVKDV